MLKLNYLRSCLESCALLAGQAWINHKKTSSPIEKPKILVVVEGTNDIAFLQRLSAILHASEPAIPDLNVWEQKGDLVFIPFGGGDPRRWTSRLAGLAKPEFHLFDRDLPPETALRWQAAEMINLRPQCFAAVTRKRSLENYLHRDAIFEAAGVRIDFSDDDDVADLAAREIMRRDAPHVPWENLPARARKRHRERAKRWLNVQAVDRMTPTRLAESDPKDEVRQWLGAIVRLSNGR
jgi:hypothetical protein